MTMTLGDASLSASQCDKEIGEGGICKGRDDLVKKETREEGGRQLPLLHQCIAGGANALQWDLTHATRPALIPSKGTQDPVSPY